MSYFNFLIIFLLTELQIGKRELNSIFVEKLKIKVLGLCLKMSIFV